MLGLKLDFRVAKSPEILFIGAHCDDIEIGCGATAIQLCALYPKARVHWVVLSSEGSRAKEARAGAKAILRDAGDARVEVHRFRGAYFPAQYVELKNFFRRLQARTAPDLIFTHFRSDLHQDHRSVSELTWNTFRNHCILEYEIPKFDGDIGAPSVFVPASKALVARKVSLLMTTFKSQLTKQWFTPDTFRGVMRLRGIECDASSGYAEAFYGRKLVLSGQR